MTVVLILAILAVIVSGGVLGTTTQSGESRAKSDAATVEQAISRFRNESLEQKYPEDDITVAQVSGTPPAIASYTIGTRTVPASLVTALQLQADVQADAVVSNYKLLDWEATAQVRAPSGSSVSVTFVPDLTPRRSVTADLTLTLGSSTYNEFLWLLKVKAIYDANWSQVSARQLEVWKFNIAANAYVKIYPEAQ